MEVIDTFFLWLGAFMAVALKWVWFGFVTLGALVAFVVGNYSDSNEKELNLLIAYVKEMRDNREIEMYEQWKEKRKRR